MIQPIPSFEEDPMAWAIFVVVTLTFVVQLGLLAYHWRRYRTPEGGSE
jgi:hypothetical protein